MRKKLLATVLLLTMALSLTACDKEQATGLEVVPEFGNTETVSEVEEVKEVSLLEGQSYRVEIMSQNNTTSYKKTVSGSEYSYTLSDVNLLLGQSQAYCNGTDLYVYTNVSPTGASLDEYVWIRNGANPFEQIENDIFNLFVPSNMTATTDLANLEFTDEDFIDDMPYLKSLGYESVEMVAQVGRYEFRLKDGEMNTDCLRISVEGQSFFGSNPPIVVPDITDCKEVTDFNSSAEQLSGNGVITEEDYANHLVDGYYLADGTFSYSESKEQSWEWYKDGTLIGSYDYESDTFTDYQYNTTTVNFYRPENEEENKADIVYAGEGGYATSDYSMYADIVTLDNTFAEIVSADWYWGEVQEGFEMDGLLMNCKDTAFSERFDEVYNTFEVRYAVENFDKFDEETRVCLVGIAEAWNFTIDGQTSFKDMLLASGLENTTYVDLASKYYLLANGGTVEVSH